VTDSNQNTPKLGKFLSYRREEIIESQYNEIKKLESKYCRLYDEAPDMYRTINTDGIILECNQSYVRELGYSSKDEVIGHSIFEHVSEHNLDAMRDSFEQWKRAGMVRNKEVWFKRKDGTTFPVLISANNLYDDQGRIIGSNSAIIDETEMYRTRKQLQEAKQLQEEFIKIAAHELRTPVQPILSYIELAKRKIVDKDTALDEIYVQAKRLGKLATDILDVSRIESGSLVYRMQKVNCNELIERAISSANALLDNNENSKVSIVADLNSTDGLDIVVDPDRIMQVITNILNNAIKFTEEGTIRVSTGLDIDSKRVLVEASDTGTGISEQIIPKMFEKFTSLSSVDATKQGTGLGLYLSEKIVQAHKGTLWGKNNKDGKGATFAFSLPLDSKEDAGSVNHPMDRHGNTTRKAAI
jgi:PAS domain S-box-containing protein